jgi:hypothetical protein
MGTFGVPAVSTHDGCIGLLVLSTNETQATTTVAMLILSIAALYAHCKE